MHSNATLIPSIILLALACGNSALSAEFGLSEVALQSITRSEGGPFLLTSSVGDPFVGSAVGGSFTLATGLPDEETSAPPPVALEVRRSENAVILVWPVSTTNWEVEFSDELDGPWQSLSVTPRVLEGERRLELSPSEVRRYFRLRAD